MKLEIDLNLKSTVCKPEVVHRALALLERIAVALETLAEASEEHTPTKMVVHYGAPQQESP